MNNRLFRYLKNKQNTRRIKPLTIDEAHEIANEIERLNNIINELEKWLKSLMTPKENWQGDITYNIGIRVDLILDKLKELKGENDE